MGLGKWLFARTYDRINDRWERNMVEHRRRVVGAATGEVLEIGGGTGNNLPYYDPSVRLTVLEPNPHMAEILQKRAAELGRQVTVAPEQAESPSMPDGSFDSVVSTMVLCTVKDLDAVIRHARRLLRPGGTYRFFEHIAAPGRVRRRMQDLVNPCWRLVTDGCNLDRDITGAFERAGFAELEIEAFDLPVGPPLQNPHIIGRARR